MENKKRTDYLKWDEYFMGIAMLSASRSKDPNTGVGACIVDEDNRILSLGYNGMPIGCSDDEYPWGRDGGPLETKYFYVCHAELNAILTITAVPCGARGYIRHCFRAMNVQSPLSRRGSKRLFICPTNMRIPILCGRQNA